MSDLRAEETPVSAQGDGPRASSDFNAFPDVEEILGGFTGRRANRTLYLIEARTAHLAARARQAMEQFLPEEISEERELAYIEAFAEGRDTPKPPSIQDLEVHANGWAYLVPGNPRLKAAIAHALGQKYSFTRSDVPSICRVLELDNEAVQRAYRSEFRQPLDEIYKGKVHPLQRVKWVGAAFAKKVDALPPFWTAYSLTITETVGASILGLPIAVAAVGPLAGLFFLLLLGAVNVLTISFMSEAVVRSATIRFGHAFIGRVVDDYLGQVGSLVLRGSLFVKSFLVLHLLYLGFALSLQGITGVPAVLWVALLVTVGILIINRDSINATVASALVVGGINIAVIVAISVLALLQFNPANFAEFNVPFVGGGQFDPTVLQLIFGVMMAAYFGHMSISNCAKVVLRREPSGRSLVLGAMTAHLTVIFLYSLWVVSINGALPAGVLENERGTVVGPLVAQLGPLTGILCTVLVTLGLGMGSVHNGLGLYNLAREALPAQTKVVLLLTREGRLVLSRSRQRGKGNEIGLVYLGYGGIDSKFRFDVQTGGQLRSIAVVAQRHVDSSAALSYFPDGKTNPPKLTLEVLEAGTEHAKLMVSTSLHISYDGDWTAGGLEMSNLLTMPERDAELLAWLLREGEATLAQVAQQLRIHPDAARSHLQTLAGNGHVVELHRSREITYKVQPGRRRTREARSNIWDALDTEAPKTASTQQERVPSVSVPARVRMGLTTSRTRSLLSLSPILANFLLSVGVLLSGAGSFTGLMSVIGVILIPLLAGIFPVLLLLSSRRKGEYIPEFASHMLGNPVLLGTIFVFFLASVFLHALVVWSDPLQQATAFIAGCVIVGMTAILVKQNAFQSRLNIMLQEQQGLEGGLSYTVTANGRAIPAAVDIADGQGTQHVDDVNGELPNFAQMREITFRIPRDGASKLWVSQVKVWAQSVGLDGETEPLPVVVSRVSQRGNEDQEYDMTLLKGQVVLPFNASEDTIKIVKRG